MFIFAVRQERSWKTFCKQKEWNYGVTKQRQVKSRESDRRTDEVVAVALIREISEDCGCIEMLSVLPEYMGLGLSSSLLRNCEFILHEAGKTELQMKVFLPNSYSKESMARLGFTVVCSEPWTEMRSQLKESTFDSWSVVTVSKKI